MTTRIYRKATGHVGQVVQMNDSPTGLGYISRVDPVEATTVDTIYDSGLGVSFYNPDPRCPTFDELNGGTKGLFEGRRGREKMRVRKLADGRVWIHHSTPASRCGDEEPVDLIVALDNDHNVKAINALIS